MDLENLMDLKNLKDWKNLSPKLMGIIGGSVILVLAVITVLFYFRTQAQNVSGTPPSQKAAQEEVKKLVSEVGKLIDLPQGEDPTVATVTDVTKLQAQPFFQKAKNGDKVLIYSGAKKAILYDPAAKKVIDIAPINVGSPSAQVASPNPSSKPSPTPKPSPAPVSSPNP